MDIVAVKAYTECFKKTVSGLSEEVEARLRKVLHIKSDPFNCGMLDIQKGKQLKVAVAKLDSIAEIEASLTMKAVRQYVNALGDEDEVVLLDAGKYSNYDILCWIHALAAREEGHNPVEVYHAFRYTIPGKFFPRYNLFFYADLGYNQYFGEQDKRKRVCRFCHATGAEKFGKPENSHAISWFLGNDALFCLEECKECNNTFGSTIENALSSYYQYYRAAERRKSRKGKPLTATGVNYELLADGGLRVSPSGLVKNVPRVGEKLPKEGLQLQLNNKEPVVLHDVYRVLVKYALACMPGDLIPAFQTTVDWVRGKKHPRKGSLPPVYRVETLDDISTPSLCIYVRNNEKKDLPFCVGELRFMENLYIYALPYCKGHDMMNTALAAPLARFVSTRYPGFPFTIENFCDDEKKMIVNHVNIKGDGVLMPFSEKGESRAEDS